MTMALSIELADELARNGNRPLTVEDPRTHRQYLIIPANKSTSPQNIPAENGTEGWNQDKNARRFALIDKDIAGTITGEEVVELAKLQQEISAFLSRVAPLPIKEARELHDQLMKLALDSENR
jgi:hypothetical protein